MGTSSLGGVLRLAFFAGVLAGLSAGLWHFLTTESLIQRAITLETAQTAAMGNEPKPEHVSRQTQRLGLVLGFWLYGAALGVLFGLAFWYASIGVPQSRVRPLVLGLTLIGYWTLGVFPLLKYPANLPGEGAAENIGLRQGLYAGFLVLSVLGVLFMAAVYKGLGRMRHRRYFQESRWVIVGILYVLYALLIYVAMPNNLDPVLFPRSLVTAFRWSSLGGITIFWMILGSLFALMMPHSYPP